MKSSVSSYKNFIRRICVVLLVFGRSTTARNFDRNHKNKNIPYLPHSFSKDHSSIVELNPEYEGVDSQERIQQQKFYYEGSNFEIDTSISRFAPEPFPQQIRNYLQRFQRSNPALFGVIGSSAFIFLAWQVPKARPILSEHFICSWHNLRRYRFDSLLLAAVSHTGLYHLFVNTLALVSFGPKVKQAIAPQPIWPFLIGAAVSGSLGYLTFAPKRTDGGCLGASGMTLALMAAFARLFPSHTLRFFVGPFPVRLSSDMALYAAFAASILGILFPGPNPTIAHSAHLGGLLFGSLYYEWWVRQHVWRGRRSKTNSIFG